MQGESDSHHPAPGETRIGRILLIALAVVLFLFWLDSVYLDRPPLLNDAAGDILRIHLPNVKYSIETLRSGQLPLWNPNEFCGMPMFAGLEFGPLYPPNWLFFFVPLDTGHLVGALLHQLLLAIGSFLFLTRALGLRSGPAFFGAACIALSGWSTFRMLTEFDAYRSAAYIPWILLLGQCLIDKTTYARAVLLAGVLALQLLAGETEIWVRTLMLLAAFSAFRLIQSVRSTRSWTNVARPSIALVASVAIALGLVAVQMLPTFEASEQSLRSTSGLSFDHAFRDGVSDPAVLLSSMAIYDYPSHGQFFGLLPLAMAFYALTRRRPETWFFLVVAIAAFALILGDQTIIARMYYALPTGNWFRAPIRFLPYLIIAGGFLSAIGVQLLIDDLFIPAHWIRRVLAVLFLAGLAIPSAMSDLAASRVEFISAAIAAIVLVVMTIILTRIKRNTAMSGIGVAVLCTGYLALPATLYDLREFNIPEPLDFIGPAKPAIPAMAEGLKPGDRVYVDYAFETGRRQPKFGTVTGLPAINGVSAFMPRAFWQFIYPYSSSRIRAYHDAEGFENMSAQSGLWGGLTIESGAMEALRILGVRRVGLGLGSELQHRESGGEAPLPDTFRTIYDNRNAPLFDRFSAYDLAEAWPRVFVLNADHIATLNELKRSFEAENVPANVAIYRANEVRIRLPGKDGLLVLTDQFYPGWRARIDGEAAHIEEVAGLFRGVRVPANARELQFYYRPRSAIRGLAITAITLVACLTLLIVQYVRARRSKSTVI